jgi:hypothetical protein
MADPTGFQKARLDIEGGQRLECWLNPTQYSIAKANDWTTRPVVGTSLPQAQFATDQLFTMMEVDQSLGAGGSANQARPPTITLSWGSFTSFKAVCRHLHVQFELFSPDGTPIRALAALTLVQVEKDARSGGGTPAPAQNPTTRADRRVRSHTVRDGDSLPLLAFEYLGDATRWREIAVASGIDDPLRLERGRRLEIPG